MAVDIRCYCLLVNNKFIRSTDYEGSDTETFICNIVDAVLSVKTERRLLSITYIVSSLLILQVEKGLYQSKQYKKKKKKETTHEAYS